MQMFPMSSQPSEILICTNIVLDKKKNIYNIITIGFLIAVVKMSPLLLLPHLNVDAKKRFICVTTMSYANVTI